jgi:hypothetical protein
VKVTGSPWTDGLSEEARLIAVGSGKPM